MVKLFWDKKWGKDKICSITFHRLRPGKGKNGLPYCIYLNCNHGFYTSALLKWVNSSDKPTCPVCRKKFNVFKLLLKHS